MVFYLKYRPQKLSELDLVEVREGLTKMVKSGKVPHALLFAGPRGTGKTSAARILAKAVNCLKNKGKGEPCNHCQICQAITEGTALDIIEIDAASNRGIDDVRSLREKIKLAPISAAYKVYIIDEVQMLTTEAFNALLKTLEEPPKHAIFILCTTAPEKLPETILSRCSRFNFRKARPEEVINSLKRVVRGEKLKVEEEALKIITQSVDGSFRDGQKILDQLAVSGKKITLKEAEELLGQIEALAPTKLLRFLATKETKEAISEIGRLVEAGADLQVFTQSLLESLRRALLAKLGVVTGEESEIKGIETIEDLKTLIGLFSHAAERLPRAVIPQLPLEMAVVEWSLNVNQDETEAKPSQNPRPQQKNPTSGKVSLHQVMACWPKVLAGVRPLNHSVEALLRATRPLEINDTLLTLEVFYQFHKEQLEMEKCRRIVEEVVESVLGAPVKLKCVLGERDKRAEKVNEIPAARLTDEQSHPGEENEEIEESDIIKAAEEIFGSNAN
jgi:DNA polymerase-3 subunit gamma/tau